MDEVRAEMSKRVKEKEKVKKWEHEGVIEEESKGKRNVNEEN